VLPIGILQKSVPTSLGIEHLLGKGYEVLCGNLVYDGLLDSTIQRGANVHHWFGKRQIARLHGSVMDGHLIVVFEFTRLVCVEYATDAAHTEFVQFRRSQSAHAGRTEDSNALIDRPEDFLVPDGRDAFEIAVDNANDARAI